MHERCVSCGKRRGGRYCPALGGYICSRCCGEKRLVEISCPESCPHLRHHEAFQREKLTVRYREAWVRVNSDIAKDREELQSLFLLERAVLQAAERMRGVTDEQIAAGLSDLDSRLSPIELISRPDTPFGRLLWGFVSAPVEAGTISKARLRRAVGRLERVVKELSDPRSPRAFIRGLAGTIAPDPAQGEASRFIVTPEDLG